MIDTHSLDHTHSTDKEIVIFDNYDDLVLTVNENNLNHCNTYFDPITGWILEKRAN